MIAKRWQLCTRASSCLQAVTPDLHRCKASAASTDGEQHQGGEAQPAAPRSKKTRSPDAWRDRVPPNMYKVGSKLRKDNPEAFERMRILLGYYDLPHNRLHHPSKRAKIDKVYVSNLQTLRYIGFDPAFKLEVMRYKTSTLNRELEPVLADTQALICKLKGRQGSSDFVPSIPGMTTVDGQAKR